MFRFGLWNNMGNIGHDTWDFIIITQTRSDTGLKNKMEMEMEIKFFLLFLFI